MAAPRRIDVRIGSMNYHLLTGDDEAYARRIAAQADQLVRRIQMANPSLNQSAALTLALVNTVDENQHLSAQVEILENRLQESDSRVSESRTEMLRLRSRLEATVAELARLRTEPRHAGADAPTPGASPDSAPPGWDQTTFDEFVPAEGAGIENSDGGMQ